MSVLTSVLKLFKYDPVADKKSTYNITQALNDNWDKIDAKAAEVDEALAGKADAEAALKSTGDNPTNFKLNQVARIINEDARFPVNYGTYVCARSSKDNIGGCYALHLYYGGDYLWFQQTSELNEITLAGWHKLTTATPPTEDDLLLETGISEVYGGCKYFKTQDGIVILIINAAAATPTNTIKIGTLPAGCRPIRYFVGSCLRIGMTPPSARAVGSLDISTDGSITSWCDASNDTIFGAVVFVAGN